MPEPIFWRCANGHAIATEPTTKLDRCPSAKCCAPVQRVGKGSRKTQTNDKTEVRA